jgi:thioredoxin
MNLTDINFDKEINDQKGKLVLIDFFATWCEPCSLLAPILEKLAENFKDKVVFMKANVDDVRINAQKFKVESIPKIVVLKDGKAINGFVGLMPEKTIKDWLENIIKTNV